MPVNRPDKEYWETHFTERRKKFSTEQMVELQEAVEIYSVARFEYGDRLTLIEGYAGIPKGTRCTIVKVWPRTKVRWDIWSKAGYGATKRETTMSYNLDIILEPYE
jgi:hypothetical protein